MARALAITLALFALLLGVTAVRYGPPSPVAADAPKERFSAERARAVLEKIVGDGDTRAVGTPGNDRARRVIVSELERVGWTVETERAMSCTYHGTCASVANVVARLPGREPTAIGGGGPGVLLTAHYDSVLVSPGASDDGTGAATLIESARALAEGQRPRRPVIVLLSDGEESGLLGADAFVRRHASLGEVRTTVNVDSRGSHGPSFMFETSRGNAWLVSMMAEHLERPVTTSLFYEVYKRMPNDADFSITKTIAAGVNFANTAGIENYHTPLDTLAAADRGTLQHHGDHVLSMARAFADSDPPASRSDAGADAVWFDVLAFGIIRWPARLSTLLALIALALVAGQAFRSRAFDRGLVAFLAVLPGVFASWGMGVAMTAAGALPAPWIAHPIPALVALHAAAGALAMGSLFALARHSTPRALWAGTWLGWGIVSVLAANLAPGTSYLLIVPTAAAGLAASISLVAACVVPAIVAATLVLSLATGVYDSLGFAVTPVVALPTWLLATTIAPMLSALPLSFGRRVPGALAAIALVAAAVAVSVPKFSASIPQRANVVFRQDDGTARVFVDTTFGPASWGRPLAPLLAAIGPTSREAAALPWMRASLFVDVPRRDLPPPEAIVLSSNERDGARHVRTRLVSKRGAPAIALLLQLQPSHDRHVEITVDGHVAMPRPSAAGSVLGFPAVPSEGIVVDFSFVGSEHVPMLLIDRSVGVPAGTKADDAVRARPKEAMPSQDGDLTVVTHLVSL